MANPLSSVDSWTYFLGDVDADVAASIAAQGADLVVLDWASYAAEETPYDETILDQVRAGDPDRQVVSYLSIGEAETYRYYWRKSWTQDPPDWLLEENAEWEGNLVVKYWDPAWQAIVFDYVDRIVANGFDGLYLDIVLGYEYFEDTDPGARDYRADMVAFVAALQARAQAAAEAAGRDAPVIIAQNAEELVKEDGYLDAIDGIGREDLRFYYEYGEPQAFDAWSKAEYRYALDLLKTAEAAGVETFVVEYIPEARRGVADALLSGEIEDLQAAGIPLYISRNRDLDDVWGQGEGDDGGEGGGDGGGTDPLIGGRGSDRLKGGLADEVLRGKGGADRLLGEGGDDRLLGGRGGDKLWGGDGKDRVKGGAGDDELYGDAGRDKLKGGGGDDWLDGGAGRDKLKGGAGEDVFVMSEGRDRVVDFDPDADMIALISGESWGDVELIEKGRGLLARGAEGEKMLLLGLELGDLSADHFLLE